MRDGQEASVLVGREAPEERKAFRQSIEVAAAHPFVPSL